MKIEELEAILKRNAESDIPFTIGKNKDYAVDDDALSNFKRRAEIYKVLRLDKIITTPHGVALGDVILKVDRIINLLIKGVTPKNEPLNDSWRDLRIYAGLAGINWEESNK